MGTALFKISKSDLDDWFDVLSETTDGTNVEVLSQFSLAEGWIGDLANGVIRLGERARTLHGMEALECGLLSMMRCYDAQDRAYILELFEQAATTSSSFCYSTTIQHSNGHRQPVFCIGESNGLEEPMSAGTMTGVFVFPKFKVSPLHRIA